MGSSKALVRFRGKTLFEHAAQTLQSLGVSVHLVLAAGQDLDTGGIPILRDSVPGAGPMGALLTALSQSRSPENLVLACDVPLAGPRLFEILGQFSANHDIVAASDMTGRLHPLCAIYRRTCVEEVGRRVKAGEFRMEALLRSNRIRCRLVGPKEHHLPDWRFANVNTPEELSKLELESRKFQV